MKKVISILCILLLFVFGLTACNGGNGNTNNGNTGNDTSQDQTTDTDNKDDDDTNKDETDMTKLNIKIGDTNLTASLADNSSAQALVERLKSSPVTIDMRDYGNFEKVGALGFDLPRNDEKITTSAGDIILYQGNQLCIYYDTNSWNFTRLGKIENITKSELLSILGQGNVTVTLSLSTNKSSVSKFDLASGINGHAPTVTLNSGYDMPILGLGTYSLHGNTAKNSVRSALESGVRLIDTASAYGNEEEIGEAIREAINDGIIEREDLFVITKIYPGSEMANPEQAIQACLNRLNIGYVDMMLLHHPDRNDVKAYKAIEKFVEQGKIRSIGLSNWYIEEIDNFIAQVNIKPALIQNEIHPYYQEKVVVPYMHNLGIVMQAWYPFGGRGHTGALLSDTTIVDIANAHGVTAAQVILRWHLQRGVVAIPGSSNPAHILENISVFGFELSESEMERITALDRNEKHDWY